MENRRLGLYPLSRRKGAAADESYGKRALQTWAERLKHMFADASLFAYFDNDTHACAPHNAAMLAKLMQT